MPGSCGPQYTHEETGVNDESVVASRSMCYAVSLTFNRGGRGRYRLWAVKLAGVFVGYSGGFPWGNDQLSMINDR